MDVVTTVTTETGGKVTGEVMATSRIGTVEIEVITMVTKVMVDIRTDKDTMEEITGIPSSGTGNESAGNKSGSIHLMWQGVMVVTCRNGLIYLICRGVRMVKSIFEN